MHKEMDPHFRGEDSVKRGGDPSAPNGYDEAGEEKGILRMEAQHKRGKLTARERIKLLVDHGSFTEVGKLVSAFDATQTGDKKYSDGVITGYATIQGRRIALFSQDFTIQGGSVGKHHAQKICSIMDMAARIGCPIIGIIDSGGARITEGIHALAGYGEIFSRNVAYSGVIPQISVIVGPCAGGAVYSPALTDLIFTVDGISQLFITGPQVIEQVTGEQVTKEELGGARVHATTSGVVHMVSPDEQHCFEQVRTTLSYLPDNYTAPVPAQSNADEHTTLRKYPSEIVPSNHAQSYNIIDVIASIVDDESFLEMQAAFAPNIVTGFARIDGKSVGIVANQPLVKAGTIEKDASCKAARFINLCNAFDIPLVSLVDVPGYLPGVSQEHGGIIRHGAKLLRAYAQATIPKITIILRKAFGGAYIVMGSKHLGADFVYAWPQAQIAVLGAPAAVAIIHRKKLAREPDPLVRRDIQKHHEQVYEQVYLNPSVAAENGYIDGIIAPDDTRIKIIAALSITSNKVAKQPQKRSDNGPL